MSTTENPTVRICAAQLESQVELSRLRPLEDERFIWPKLDDILRAQSEASEPGSGFHRNEGGLWMDSDRVWIPTEASDLVMRTMVIAHCGVRAHRGTDAMLQLIRGEFSIDQLKERIEYFVSHCLLCRHVKGSHLIQRPWNVTRTATRRNELLHMDFLFMGESYGESQYLLVLKDDLSHYCELVACASTDGLVAATAVLDWYKRFGLPEMWVSDNGSHFRNTLMGELKQRLGARQRFVPVYTPWLNGTIERVNRDILQVVQVLLLGFQLDTSNWEYLLPVILSNLNQTPVRSLMGQAPVEVFTGLPREPVVNVILKPNGAASGLEVVERTRTQHAEEVEKLRASLADLHAEVVDEKGRRRHRQKSAKKGRICTFTVGDYVLWSRADPRMHGRKLMIRWVGPFRVIDELPTSFLIEHLLTGEYFDVHAIRLKHYADEMLDVNEEMKHHIALQGINLGIRAVRDARFNRRSKEWELLVSWQGLEDAEDSWEAFDGIYAAVSDIVDQFIAESNDSRLVEYLRELQADVVV